MSKEAPLKSSYELALERLRAKDREEGTEEPIVLTAAQKAEISRLRGEARAKLAEIEILHTKALAGVGADPAQSRDLDEKYRIDRTRIESRLESSIARIRRGDPVSEGD